MNEIYFSGTTREFVDAQIEKYGTYRGTIEDGVGSIYLTINAHYALNKALWNGKKYDATPIVLVSSSTLIQGRVRNDARRFPLIFSGWPQELYTIFTPALENYPDCEINNGVLQSDLEDFLSCQTLFEVPNDFDYEWTSEYNSYSG